MTRIAVYLGLSAAIYPAAVTAQVQPALVATKFAAMKGLVGTWRSAEQPTSPLRIRFYLTAGDTVLVESWERSGQPYSLTLYHRDAATLIATHYCPQGNQPRLSLVSSNRDGDIRFTFRDATDLDVDHEAYLVSLAFNLSSPKVLLRREVYRQQGLDAPSELKLVRDLNP